MAKGDEAALAPSYLMENLEQETAKWAAKAYPLNPREKNGSPG